MMNNLQINQTSSTPGVRLNKDKGYIEFTGKSLPEDVHGFFKPIIDWINEYLKNPGNQTRVICKMDYINTASSKLLLDILIRLKKLDESGKTTVVEWYYDSDDEDLHDIGKDYCEITGIQFKFHPN